MRKTLHVLGSRVLEVHRSILPCIVRMQSGFMADKNLAEIKEQMSALQHMLDEIESHLKNPEHGKPVSNNYIPFK